MDPRFQVTFIDCVARGAARAPSAEFRGVGNLTWKSWMFPWRGGGRPRLAMEKIRQRLAERSFHRSGELRTGLLSTRAIGLQEMLLAERADLYFGFNIDTLLPVYTAARRASVPFLFDCHEIHAEMSADQPETERAIIRALQRSCLRSARWWARRVLRPRNASSWISESPAWFRFSMPRRWRR
ncbi:MAG TPA: hypothetical protein VGM43_11505 [Bryobacteraceae bacterium]